MSSSPRPVIQVAPNEQLLFGRFAVVEELGSGRYGRVLLCRDADTGELVALKELRHFGPDALVRFKREFRTLSDIQHPNLVRLNELLESETHWAYTLEYVPGQDARSWVRSARAGEPAFDEERLRTLLRGLVAGLRSIHSLGIVHRDIKPENVRVTPEGRVVILDFGIAAHMRDERDTDGVAGTAAYMSPEHARGERPTPASDWYAVGVLLYEALTGRLPFEGRRLEMMVAKQSGPPPPPSSIVDVPASLEQLCMALLVPEPSERADADAILRVLGAGRSDLAPIQSVSTVGDDLFVGRRQELNELRRHLESVELGASRLVLLEGESGIGKSSLVSRFLSNARRLASAPLVLSARCHAAERLLYNAFDSVVDELSRYLKRCDASYVASLMPEDANLLAVLFPVLTRVPAIAHASTTSPYETVSRGSLHGAFAELLARVSRHVPVILHIDDMQWADEPSFSLLEALLEVPRASRLLIVATVRPIALLAEPIGGRVANLVRHPRAARTVVGRLHETETRELLSRLLGTGASRAHAERVITESGGHPLFVNELARHAQENAGTQSELDLDAAIVARVARLDARALKVLTVSCLAAGPLPYSVLAAAVELEHEALRAALAALRARKLLRMARRDETIFYHDRIREAVVQSQEPFVRAAYHEALARAFQAQIEVEPARVAYHLLQAGLRDRAVPWLTAAAQRATKALAFERAAELYRKALSGVERTDPARQQLCMELGTALQQAGRREDAAKAFESAARHATGATRESMLLRAADQWLTGGFTNRGLPLLRKVGVRLPRGVLFTLIGASYHFAAITLVRSFRVLSRSVVAGERTVRIDSYWTLATGLAFIEPLQSMYFSAKGARLSLALGDSHRIARGLCGASFAASALGMKPVAARLNLLAAQAARHEATSIAAFYASGGRFLSAFLIDHDWAACIAKRAELDALWREAGLGRSFETDVLDLVETWALANLGELNTLRKRYEELKDVSRRGGNPFLEIALRVYHSVLFLAADDASGAEADLEDALSTWSPDGQSFQLPHAWASFCRGDILLYLGLPERRGELEADVRALRRTLLHRIQWVRIRRDHVQARLALAEAAKTTGAARRRALRDARRWLARLRAYKAPACDAWLTLLDAGLAHIEADEASARLHLERAVSAFAARGMALYEQAARYRLGEVIGGSEGEARCAEARSALTERGVANVRRMLRMLAPGWL